MACRIIRSVFNDMKYRFFVVFLLETLCLEKDFMASCSSIRTSMVADLIVFPLLALTISGSLRLLQI